MQGKRAVAAAVVAAVGTLAGCTMGPDFHHPGSWSPDHWFSSTPTVPKTPSEPVPSQTVAEPVDPHWWRLFGDAELVSLEQRVVGANLDVRTATIRVAESRAQRKITSAAEFPTLDGSGSYQRELPAKNGVFSLLSGGSSGGPGLGGAQGVSASSLPIQPFDLYQLGLDSSWELDLWGRVRRSVEVADASLEADVEARHGAILSAMAEVARDYIQLRAIQAELDISRRNLDIAHESIRLAKDRADHGFATEIDVVQASAQALTTEATLPQLAQRQAQAINQLSFLLDMPPRALESELVTPAPVPPVPPRVPVGIPSELAHRRPDIREAEARLHAATAQIGVAEASFYPSFSLTGSLDQQALQFKQLWNVNALTYMAGPAISLPIFEGGRLAGNLTLTKAEQREAATAFERTVLNAWQEVDNALTAYDEEQRRHARIVAAASFNRRALALAQDQYRHGLVTYLQVLTAQQQLLASEQQEVESNAAISLNLVSLYTALGGGWEDADRAAAPPATEEPK